MMILAAITVVLGLIFAIMGQKTQDILNKITIENGEETLGKRKMSKADLDTFLLHSLTNARNLIPQIVAVVLAYEPGMGPETPKGEFMGLARFTENEIRLVTGANYQDKE